jgi:hypothetical protein
MNSFVIASSSGGGGAVAGAVVGIVIALVVRGRRRGGGFGGSRKRTIVLSVVAAVAVLGLIGSLIASSSRQPDTFASADGKAERAGFLDGCEASVGQLVDCRCIFERLSSKPPFDKPSGFDKLIPVISDAKSAADLPADLRNVLTRALLDCRAA